MRKKVGILVFVALIALTIATPALAANGPNDKPFFTLVGIVKSANIDEFGAGSIVVTVYHGNRFLKDKFFQDVTVLVDEGTEYRRWTPAGCVPTDPSNVNADDTISIHGFVVEGVFEGDRVTVDVPLDCCTP
jgi:hypothetical protein